MKKIQHNAVSIVLLSVLIVSMVFMLTGCGIFNQGPTARFSITEATEDNTYMVGEELTFDASASSDSNGSIASYDWDFNGDGNFTDTGKTPKHTYSSAGTYSVSLKVTDDSGATDVKTKDIEIQAPANLFASFTVSPHSPKVGETVTFDASSSTGDIANYKWDFNYNTGIDVTTTNASVTHTYTQTGSYMVHLTINDGEGDKATSGMTVEVKE
ncbi:PKD domain-containing protein [Candidatus Bipolaricaulota bacterium]|nr:PKD domain-containing protein [Candidatus Bipolaricaulota bacterium]